MTYPEPPRYFKLVHRDVQEEDVLDDPRPPCDFFSGCQWRSRRTWVLWDGGWEPDIPSLISLRGHSTKTLLGTRPHFLPRFLPGVPSRRVSYGSDRRYLSLFPDYSWNLHSDVCHRDGSIPP